LFVSRDFPDPSRRSGECFRLILLMRISPDVVFAPYRYRVSVNSDNAHAVGAAGHVDGDLIAVAGNFNVGNAVA
jgi:hypothetical protein